MHLDDYTCVLCSTGCEETGFHLFFECSFSQSCWSTIPIAWNTNLQPLDLIIEARTDFGNALFREIFISACWVIWTTRNSIIFYNGNGNLSNWKREFREELDLVCIKAKPSRQHALKAWRDSYIQPFPSFSFGPCCLVLCCLQFLSLCTEHSFIQLKTKKILGRGFPY